MHSAFKCICRRKNAANRPSSSGHPGFPRTMQLSNKKNDADSAVKGPLSQGLHPLHPKPHTALTKTSTPKLSCRQWQAQHPRGAPEPYSNPKAYISGRWSGKERTRGSKKLSLRLSPHHSGAHDMIVPFRGRLVRSCPWRHRELIKV